MGKRQEKEKRARRRVASERRGHAVRRSPVRPGRLSPDREVPASIPRPPYAPDAPALVPAVPPDEFADRMRALRATLATTAPFDVTTTEQALRALAGERGVSAGKLIHPLRLALTGKSASPPIFDVAVVLGKEKTLRRLDRLITWLTAG